MGLIPALTDKASIRWVSHMEAASLSVAAICRAYAATAGCLGVELDIASELVQHGMDEGIMDCDFSTPDAAMQQVLVWLEEAFSKAIESQDHVDEYADVVSTQLQLLGE